MKWKYPEIPNLDVMRPTPRILLGKKLYWTEKRDGSNIAIYYDNGELFISSRHQKVAAPDIIKKVKATEEYPKVLELLKDNPSYIIYVEALLEGRSPTRIELHEKNELVAFDIHNRTRFLDYRYMYQQCYHYNIPVVELWAETRHTSMKDLLKFCNYITELAKAKGREGAVVKTFDKQGNHIYAKVKIDIPKPKIRKIAKGTAKYPPIPESEILSAIDKAFVDLGLEKFREVRVAMPLIAQYVKEECKKHLYSSPSKKLFIYYKKVLEEKEKS